MLGVIGSLKSNHITKIWPDGSTYATSNLVHSFKNNCKCIIFISLNGATFMSQKTLFYLQMSLFHANVRECHYLLHLPFSEKSISNSNGNSIRLPSSFLYKGKKFLPYLFVSLTSNQRWFNSILINHF